MNKALVWQIHKDGPRRLPEGKLILEKHLEDWIEADPNLLQFDLTIVGRQLVVEAGRIDLLALDSVGHFVVVEVKRGILYRDTVAQGLDYVLCIKSLPAEDLERSCGPYLKRTKRTLRSLLEERGALDQLDPTSREVSLYVVGAGRTERLSGLAELLKDSVAIYLVTFDVYTLADRQQILVRELSEVEAHGQRAVIRKIEVPPSLETMSKKADAAGIGKDFRRLCKAGQRLGLYPKVWKRCVMFAPPEARNRLIFTIWPKPEPGRRLGMVANADAIAEYYPVSASVVRRAIGKTWRRQLDSRQVTKFIGALEGLFSSFREKTDTKDA